MRLTDVVRWERLSDRFWSKVEKSEGCWLWVGHRNKAGYGKLRNGSQHKYLLAHRASWLLAHGELPDELLVCHKCDNPPCVRPDHLFLGTDADNQRDMMRKGRKVVPPQYGERNPRAKLTAEQVIEIRRRYAEGETQTKLGMEYGVSQAAIGYIVRGEHWTEF